MTNLIKPIFVGAISGRDVCFFRNPKDDGPSMPWCSIDDLHEALRLPRSLRQHLKRISQKHWTDELETIATKTGLTTVGPHVMAQSLIEVAMESGRAPQSLESDYQQAAASAMSVLTAFMPDAAACEYMVSATRRHIGLPSKPVRFTQIDCVVIPQDPGAGPDDAS